MALKKIEISLVGSSIALRPVDSPNNKPYEYYPISGIQSVTSVLNTSPTDTYPYAEQAVVTINFINPNRTPLKFDVQDVSNHGTWLATEAGLMTAVTEINSWITSGSGGASSTPGSVSLTENDAMGGNGTEFLATGVPMTGKNYKYIVINEDATITSMVGSTTTDLKADLLIAGNTVTKGMIIRGLDGETITAVTLVGSGFGIL